MEKNNIQTAEDYELLYDLHTHTTYSHGKGSIEDNVREAFNQGLEFVAISDHGRDIYSTGSIAMRSSICVMILSG